MLIELPGRIVLGIHDQREDGRLRPHGARNGIDNESGTETLARATPGNGQAADQSGGQQGIARQPPDFLRQEFGNRQAARGEGVVAGDSTGLVERDEAVGHPATYVLRDLLAKITVERLDAAVEGPPIVGITERFDNEWPAHREAVITRRWRSMACFIAGVSGGGLRIASTKAR